VELRKKLAWLKEWRVRVLAFGCAAAGFAIGLLVSGKPWNLPPAWGDIPTWLLVAVGVIGGWAALRQLRILQEQVKGEAERNVKRDQLLDRQLAEAAAREAAEQRRQAEDIELILKTRSAFAGDPRNPARPAYVEAYVINNSRRPITGIIGKIMSRADGRVLAEADAGGAAMDVRSGPSAPAAWAVPRWGSVTRCEVLAPGSSWAFRFDDLVLADDQAVASWFTDDAEVHWRLDEMQHLVQTADESQYQR
jgi:hypothetical protein